MERVCIFFMIVSVNTVREIDVRNEENVDFGKPQAVYFGYVLDAFFDNLFCFGPLLQRMPNILYRSIPNSRTQWDLGGYQGESTHH